MVGLMRLRLLRRTLIVADKMPHEKYRQAGYEDTAPVHDPLKYLSKLFTVLGYCFCKRRTDRPPAHIHHRLQLLGPAANRSAIDFISGGGAAGAFSAWGGLLLTGSPLGRAACPGLPPAPGEPRGPPAAKEGRARNRAPGSRTQGPCTPRLDTAAGRAAAAEHPDRWTEPGPGRRGTSQRGTACFPGTGGLPPWKLRLARTPGPLREGRSVCPAHRAPGPL